MNILISSLIFGELFNLREKRAKSPETCKASDLLYQALNSFTVTSLQGLEDEEKAIFFHSPISKYFSPAIWEKNREIEGKTENF